MATLPDLEFGIRKNATKIETESYGESVRTGLYDGFADARTYVDFSEDYIDETFKTEEEEIRQNTYNLAKRRNQIVIEDSRLIKSRCDNINSKYTSIQNGPLGKYLEVV